MACFLVEFVHAVCTAIEIPLALENLGTCLCNDVVLTRATYQPQAHPPIHMVRVAARLGKPFDRLVLQQCMMYTAG